MGYRLIFPSLNLAHQALFIFLGLYWDALDMSVYLPSDKLFRYSSCLILCYRRNLLQSVRLCTSRARLPFVPMDMHNLACCVMSFIYFFPFTFPFQHSIRFGNCLSCSRVQFLDFLFVMLLSLWMPHLIIGLFIFRVLTFLYPVVEAGPVLCIKSILLCKNSRSHADVV